MSKLEAAADVVHKAIRASGRTYRVHLEPDPEEGGYVVHCDAPPRCSSQGETVEEAL